MAHESYLDPYYRLGSKFGTNFGVTLWASEQSQQRRFEVFTELAYFPGKRVLDAGCSRGDFAAFLNDRQLDYASYVGVDALEHIVEFANTRGLPNARFISGDLIKDSALLATDDPQIVCISGTLNTMTDAQVYTLLESAWAGTSETLMFNFLSDRCSHKAPVQDKFSRRLDALALLRWALGKTWCVVLRQDYFSQGHDATIMLRRV